MHFGLRGLYNPVQPPHPARVSAFKKVFQLFRKSHFSGEDADMITFAAL
jgi:hypothetical protein